MENEIFSHCIVDFIKSRNVVSFAGRLDKICGYIFDGFGELRSIDADCRTNIITYVGNFKQSVLFG